MLVMVVPQPHRIVVLTIGPATLFQWSESSLRRVGYPPVAQIRMVVGTQNCREEWTPLAMQQRLAALSGCWVAIASPIVRCPSSPHRKMS